MTIANLTTLSKVPATQAFMPTGTVYGTLLNFKAELAALQPQMNQPPYKAPPQAPVLYVKPANTWSANGADIAVPTRVPEVEIGATIAMVVSSGLNSQIRFVLMNDLSIPHSSFFRPPVKFKCLDGFLGIGSNTIETDKPQDFKLEVHVNGDLVQSLNFSQLVRPAGQLLADVSEFMTLHDGDVLMLGCDCLSSGKRPLAKVGDVISISSPNHPALGTLSNTLVALIEEAA
jgi:5-oxopent-3-ene-1,2,5-tricarboxylate decarboxylase/2-hydroxyhepta-2,4-diene-1,7-dioate isomerase